MHRTLSPFRLGLAAVAALALGCALLLPSRAPAQDANRCTAGATLCALSKTVAGVGRDLLLGAMLAADEKSGGVNANQNCPKGGKSGITGRVSGEGAFPNVNAEAVFTACQVETAAYAVTLQGHVSIAGPTEKGAGTYRIASESLAVQAGTQPCRVDLAFTVQLEASAWPFSGTLCGATVQGLITAWPPRKAK